MTARADLAIIVLAHNEERRIATCLGSLPLGEDSVAVHVVVNGSRDRTAEIARGFNGVHVHEFAQGGKARSWNRIMFDTPGIAAQAYVFVDGDAEVLPGSISALQECLASNRQANAASGFPKNGRQVRAYARKMRREHGLFGDLYALSGSFVETLRRENLRLPDDVIGDDSLICALAKTDGGPESEWDNDRVIPCPQAGFLCEPTRFGFASLRGQYRRMVNYSQRHFQNRIIAEIMRTGGGPKFLPRRLADHYPQFLPRCEPRSDPVWWWFDRQALARMRASA